ncbi:MAG: hypothetical protein DRJ14_00790 [Acidobacteria bacterium]|nr:MAG: hypothetical protein DRJ14_00790 [Acidobacteriota bacterium]
MRGVVTMKKLTAVCVGLLATALAFSSGFQVNEQNAQGAAMGNAYVASVDNASAMFYNPGALAFVQGVDVNISSVVFFPSSSWTSLDGSLTTDQKTKVNWLPSVYISYQLNDKVVVGISEFTQYGLETDWPTEWPGSQLSDRTKIRTFNVAPTIAFKLTDNFSMGFQVNWVGADVLIQKTISFVDQTSWLDMSGDGDGWGASAGFLWKVNDRINVGGFWRSSVNVKFDGEVDFDNVPTPFLPVLYDGEISAGVKLPQTWGLDVAYKLNEKWLVEIGFMNTEWSDYDVLAVTRKDTGRLLTAVPKNWTNVTMYKVGVKYDFSEKLTLRAGYIYDEAGNPDNTLDPSLPDNNRNDFSAGFDWKFKNFTVSAFAMYVRFNDRTTTTQIDNLNGSYSTDAILVGAGLDYRF